MKRFLAVFFFFAFAVLPAGHFPGALAGESIICASTTSTQNSGFFDYISPLFEKKTGISVRVIAVGTGAAIELGKRGDADVVLVHARELEMKALGEGHFVDRRDLMHNDFIIAGPLGDPAKLKETRFASDAFRRIAEGGHAFVSRGDKSGTHAKEVEIWGRAGIAPQGRKFYLEVGQGMEKAIRIAYERRAYVLTDRATWLAAGDGLDMEVVFEGDPALFNQYGVMIVNPERHPYVKYTEAKRFVEWLVSKEGQAAIGSFRDKNGNVLFVPSVQSFK